MTALQPWLDRGAQAYARAMAVPGVRARKELLTFLLGMSGAFWLLSKAASRVAAGIHHALDRSLADLFAVVYNLALSVLFASVLVFAIYAERGGKDDFLAYQAAAFVLIYVVLGSVYAEKSGKVSEYALPGYWGGLAAFLFFCLRSQYLRNPVTPRAYEWVSWAMRGWVGKAAAAFTALQLLYRGLRALGRKLSASLSGLTPQRRTS